jgi:hypothetical protein
MAIAFKVYAVQLSQDCTLLSFGLTVQRQQCSHHKIVRKPRNGVSIIMGLFMITVGLTATCDIATLDMNTYAE